MEENQTKIEEKEAKMEEFVPLELWMRSADVTGWPALVGQIVNKIDFETALKCREVSTTFKYFLDNDREVWISILDGVRGEYLDKLLLETNQQTCPCVSAMSPEKVHNDHKSWMIVLEKIKRDGTIEDIILFGKLMKQSKKLIISFACFCPIESLFSFFDTGDANFGFEKLATISMKVFQTFLRLRLEEEDELISMHFDHMISKICISQNPEVVQYFMTKLMRFDPIKTRDDIKNFDEELRQWLEERTREVSLREVK